MTKISTPHNNFFEAMLSNKEIVTDFLKIHLPKDIQTRLDFNSIRPEKNTFVSEELRKSETDVLFSVNLDGKPSYVYTLIEHQSTPDKKMPIRLHKYMLSAMEWHINMKKGETIPVIIPLVIYNSRIPWNYPTGVVSMFDKDQQELAKNILINDFKLVNLHDIDDNQIMQHNWASLLELSLKWARERDIIEILEKVKPFLIMACKDNKKIFFSTLNYLVDVGEADKDKLIEYCKQNLTDDEGEIMTVAEQWKEEGKKETALKMLKHPNKKYTKEEIEYLTGLPINELENLEAKNQEDFDSKE
jgi:predicted transposase/invertase (TIGR01784 family)